MATNEQRAQEIADAIINKVATASQVNRLGSALARQDGDYAAYQSATNSGKAGMLVQKIRTYCINVVKATEASAAAQTAADGAISGVDGDFSEGP